MAMSPTLTAADLRVDHAHPVPNACYQAIAEAVSARNRCAHLATTESRMGQKPALTAAARRAPNAVVTVVLAFSTPIA